MRITLAVLILAACAGISALAGWGPAYPSLLALVCLYLILTLLSPPGREKAVTVMLWCSIGIAAVAAAQMPFIPRPPSVFRSPNYLGAFAAIMLFLAWRKAETAVAVAKRPVFAWCAVAANAVSLCLAQSRGALLAAGAGVCVMLWRRSRLAALLGAAIAIAGVFVIRSGSEQARLDLWRIGWQAFAQRPVTGWGPGGLSVWSGLSQFHSIPLDLAVGCGLVGLAAGAWLAAAAWRTGAEHRPFLAAWAVQGIFLPEHPATMIPLAVVLALISVRAPVPGHDPLGPGIVHDHEPLADSGARALGAE